MAELVRCRDHQKRVVVLTEEIEPAEGLDVRPDTHTPIDPSKVELIYDRPGDTLYLLLNGRERPSVVVGGPDPYLFLADPITGELLGIQIEDFFSYAARENPRLLEAIHVARLRGISRAEADEERSKILGRWGALSAWMRRMFWYIQTRSRSRQRVVVRELFSDETLGLSDPLTASFA